MGKRENDEGRGEREVQKFLIEYSTRIKDTRKKKILKSIGQRRYDLQWLPREDMFEYLGTEVVNAFQVPNTQHSFSSHPGEQAHLGQSLLA